MAKLSSRFVILVFTSLLVNAVLCVAQTSVLRNYNPKGKFAYYINDSIAMQVARFDIVAPCVIKSVSFTISSSSSVASGRLRIFGQEGGMPVPNQEKDLIPPIQFNATRLGVEEIKIPIKQAITIKGKQFFIGVEGLSKGVNLMLDNTKKAPTCESVYAGKYYYQGVKFEDGRWEYGPFSYVISVEAENLPIATKLFKQDSAVLLQYPNLSSVSGITANISSNDYNEDGYEDILINGNLFTNKLGKLELNNDVELQAIKGSPSCFIDINNDGFIDILSIKKQESKLLLNRTNGKFSINSIDLPTTTNLTSICVADVNNDSYLDLFLGQLSTKDQPNNRNYLLINNKNNGFSLTNELNNHFTAEPAYCRGASFTDINGDGFQDIYIANYFGATDELWLGNEFGSFNSGSVMLPFINPEHRFSSGCSFGDIDNNGIPDLLIPRYQNAWYEPITEGLAKPSIIGNIESEKPVIYAQIPNLEFEERRSGGAWGDINNDGKLDCITLTPCKCRYASAYVQSKNGMLENKTYELGFSELTSNNDGLWVDIDNNGTLDFITLDSGRLGLFRQIISTKNNFVEFDLKATSGNKSGIGSKVFVYVNGEKITREVCGGRGLCVQDPYRIHVGMGSQKNVDSVIVKWPSGSTEKFVGVEQNKISNLKEGNGMKVSNVSKNVNITGVMAKPNPFRSTVEIAYSLKKKCHIKVDVLNLQGKLITTILTEEQGAGVHSCVWNGENMNKEKVATGKYFYRIQSGSESTTGLIEFIK